MRAGNAWWKTVWLTTWVTIWSTLVSIAMVLGLTQWVLNQSGFDVSLKQWFTDQRLLVTKPMPKATEKSVHTPDDKPSEKSAQETSEVVLSVEELRDLKGKLTDHEKVTMFASLTEKLTAEELRQLSEWLEQGITAQELKQIEATMKRYFSQPEVEQLVSMLR